MRVLWFALAIIGLHALDEQGTIDASKSKLLGSVDGSTQLTKPPRTKPITTTTPSTSTATTATTTTTPATTTFNVQDEFNNIAKKVLTNYQEAQRQVLMKRHAHCLAENRASPIDIDLGTTEEVNVPELKFVNYDARGMVTENYFSVFRESVEGFTSWDPVPYITGGPFYRKKFDLVEVMYSFHGMASGGFHFLERNEHTINGARHWAEIHFVHTRNGIPLAEARKNSGDVVILSVFVTTIYKNISTPFDDFSRGNDTGRYKWVSPSSLLPEDKSTYYYYNGTFPDPPCDEAFWIILANPIQIPIYKVTELFQRSMNVYTIPTFLYGQAANSNIELSKPRTTGVYLSRTFKKAVSNTSNALEISLIVLLVASILIIITLMLIVRYLWCKLQTSKIAFGFDNINLDE